MSTETLSPRMQTILDAAIQVTARAGMRGLTHRAVDAEAGLPQGSTSAYLRTRLALLEAMTGRVKQLQAGAIDELAEKMSSEEDIPTVVAAAIELFVGWLDEPEVLLARIELDREALRQSEIRALMEPGRQRVITTVAAMLEKAQVRDSSTKAVAITAAIDGVLLHAIGMPVSERTSYVRDCAATIISAFASDRARPAGAVS